MRKIETYKLQSNLFLTWVFFLLPFLGRCVVCKLERLGFSVVLLTVSVLDFSDCKTGLFPKKDILSVQSAWAVLSSATCLALPSFPDYPISEKNVVKRLLDLKCVFRFSLQCVSATFLIIRRSHRSVFINVHRSSHKAPVIRIRF